MGEEEWKRKLSYKKQRNPISTEDKTNISKIAHAVMCPKVRQHPERGT